ncbi:MAG: hypothetical protein WBB32_01435 [Flavobacteriales bacterium]
MTTRTNQPIHGGVFFCTFTCFQWLPMIERVAMYPWVYDWFKRLHNEGERMVGYVIMPNHLHFLIRMNEGRSINKLLAEGKRFMAYEIRKRLNDGGHQDLLEVMRAGVRNGDAKHGQRYRVFETSSDIKDCWSEKFLLQKLDYIHNNPVRGKWSLAEDPAKYPHSSAGFYMVGSEPVVPLLHLGELL